MAAAGRFSTALVGSRAEPVVRRNSSRPSIPSSSSSYPSFAGVSRNSLMRHGIRLAAGSRRSVRTRERRVSTRCEVSADEGADGTAVVAAADALAAASARSSSSISALEQLKVSGFDRYTKERSSVGVIGLSVHTSPVEMREKLAIPEAQWPYAIAELCELHHIEEAAVLSTCNRMEIYVVALSWNRGVREVIGWMSKTSGIPVSELQKHLFMLRDSDATCHLFEVASGLDSLVLGEGQILAQVKQVVRSGQGSGGLGKTMDRLFKDAITAGKRVRSETNISSGAVSISSAAVELALMKLPAPDAVSARVLVVGAGKMGKLVIKHLAAKGCKQMVVVNRSEERVAAIRQELKGVEIIYRPLSEILCCAAEADVIFTSTASDIPLFTKENVTTLPPVKEAVGGSRFFIDIAVPRNVGTCVSNVENVRVYNVDHLKEVVEANKEDRLRKAMEAQTIITEEIKRFEAWKDSLETVPTIKKLRSYADRIRIAELEKCLQKIGDDVLTKKVRKAVDDLSTGIVNKLLHGPLQHLRCDGGDNRNLEETLENMHALNRMFDLDTEKAILEQRIKSKVEKAQK